MALASPTFERTVGLVMRAASISSLYHGQFPVTNVKVVISSAGRVLFLGV